MAEGLSVAAANTLLDSLGTTYSWVKLHVGAPGSAGTANPAVETTRQQATWGSASGGLKSNSAQVQWTNVAGTEDYTHFTVWTASTAGSFGFSGTITANAVVAADTFTLPVGDVDVSFTTAT